ncbi:YMGG-like glycine zipper-containing protein [uncultured Massilia sp.]|uniref:YMGG-like glycine zipper-containing protein n=1 Tax=uncultured Massilia sp. TaxID=169973 RepID=UPI0025E76857|nr:glycine zipper domain-containing protein [uncultured Massilia sp.]
MPDVVTIIPIPVAAEGKAMLKTKCFGAVLLAAAAVSSTAMASDRGVNTAVGAIAGAAIGGSVGGRDGALVGGAIGAVVGNSVRTNDDYYYRDRGYVSSGYYPSGYSSGYSSGYYQPAPVYVQPRPVYVESRPYYAPPPAYYYDRRPGVVVIDRGGRGWDRHDRGWDRHDRGHGGWGHHR